MKWKAIPGFSRYEVSEIGLVRVSLKATKGWKQRKAPGDRIALRGGKQSRHLRCYLDDDLGQHRDMGAHQLVALAFHGPRPSPRHWALHWDDDPTNNHHSNIRWGVGKDNAIDRIRNGNSMRGESSPVAKLTATQVVEIREKYKGPYTHPNMRELGAEYGVTLHAINLIVKGRTWSHL